MNEQIKEIPILNVPELMHQSSIQPVDMYNEDLLIIDFSRRNKKLFNHFSVPVRLTDFSMIMVCSGECSLNINHVPCRLQKNTFMVIKENHMISKLRLSDDFTGYQIVAKKELMRIAISDNTPPVREIFEKENLYPFVTACEEDFNLLEQFIRDLIRNIRLTGHTYHHSIIINSLSNIILQLWYITASKQTKFEQQVPLVSNHERLTMRFIHLVHSNCKEKHDVAFYAKELCVTSVYLTRAIKSLTGKTAIQFINDILVDEAKLLLYRAGTSIQETAEELNFSDQAAFSKFFKKNTGLSPLEYKRSLGIR